MSKERRTRARPGGTVGRCRLQGARRKGSGPGPARRRVPGHDTTEATGPRIFEPEPEPRGAAPGKAAEPGGSGHSRGASTGNVSAREIVDGRRYLRATPDAGSEPNPGKPVPSHGASLARGGAGIVGTEPERARHAAAGFGAGTRRWLAADLGRTTPPRRDPRRLGEDTGHVVREADDRLVAELAIVENLQRKDLSPLEKALSFRRYLEQHGCRQEELAQRLKIDRSTIANLMRLLELPEQVQDDLTRGAISAGHARALLPLGDADQQIAYSKRIQDEGLKRTGGGTRRSRDAPGRQPPIPSPGWRDGGEPNAPSAAVTSCQRWKSS